MGRLSRPLVPDGPIRRFYDRLHALHQEEGQPSVRQLQRRTRSERRPTGINSTTIHDAFVAPRLARWEVIREIVRHLGGDVDEFRELWSLAREAQMLGDEIGDQPSGTAASAKVPRELPAGVYGFTGRDNLLGNLDKLLDTDCSPAVTIAALVGTAGVGKTALAVHWGHRVRDRFPDGQLYVNLRGFAAGGPMPQIEALARFLRALGLPPDQVPTDAEEAAAQFRSLLADRRMLIILDNAADSDQVRPLLPGTPSSLVLITSRDRMSGLVARDGAHRLAVGVLTADEADVLLERVLGADRVAAEPRSAGDLAQACAYLPLALRVAAANLSHRPRPCIADYVAELRAQGGLDVLDADGDEQAAVRGAFDLSYQAITPQEQRLFRMFGVFPGTDLSVEAAAALAGVPVAEAARLLDRLAAAHLAGQHAPGRYACHDLLRQYAATRAAGAGLREERDEALRRVGEWYLSTVDAAARALYPHRLRLEITGIAAGGSGFGGGSDALAWLDAERTNLIEVIRQAARTGPPSLAWLLADSLRGYLWLGMHTVQWSVAAHIALEAAQADGDERAQAAANVSLGDLAYRLGRTDQAIEHYTRALHASRDIGWKECEAAALLLIGCVHRDAGRLRESVGYHVRTLALQRDLGSRYGEAVALDCLGRTHWQLGQIDDAERCYLEALAIHREIGSRHGEIVALHDLAEITAARGRLADAASGHTRALTMAREIGDRTAEVYTLRGLAAVHRDAARPGPALQSALAALALAQEMSDRVTEADALNTLASVHQRSGRHDDAARHHQRALDLITPTGERYPQVEALIGLAAAHDALGRRERAEEHARRAAALAHEVGFEALERRALAVLEKP